VVSRAKLTEQQRSARGMAANTTEPDIESSEWREARARAADVRELVGDGEVSKPFSISW